MATEVYNGNTNDKRDPRAGQVAFTFTNFTENLSVNCDGASNDQLADALATLIGQLMEQGIIKGTISTA